MPKGSKRTARTESEIHAELTDVFLTLKSLREWEDTAIARIEQLSVSLRRLYKAKASKKRPPPE